MEDVIHDIHPFPAGAGEVALNRGLLWISRRPPMSIRIDGFGDEAAPSLPSNPGMPTVEGQFFKVRLSSSDWFSTRLGVIIAVMRTKVGLSASGESEHHANVAFHASLFGTTRSPQLVKVTNEQTEQTSV